MCKFLIDKGADLQMEDKKGMTPTHWAHKQNQPELLTLLLENGGVNLDATASKRPGGGIKKVKPVQTAVEPESKIRENDRKIPRRYMLTKLRDGGHYSPMTDIEFEEFRRLNPELARYFEQTEEGEDMQSLSALAVPEVPESAPIFDQWEKAATRILTTIQRDQKAYIFANPVDPIALGIIDYYTIVQNPMDFATIKNKLKEHKYQRIQDFMEDMELVFHNCRLYNGTLSDVGKVGLQVH